MKKIAVKMLMLIMALAVSQTTLADSKDKADKGQGKPGTEHRGFGFGQGKKGDRPQSGMQRPGQHKGFDQAKWDSIRAAHQKDGEKMKAHRDAMRQKMDSIRAAHRDAMKQKMDSLKAVHPNFGHKMDSLKAAHPNFGHKMDSLRHGRGPKFGRPMMGHRPMFRHHPPFGRHMFAHRPHGFYRPNGEKTETTVAAEAQQIKAAGMEETAINGISKDQDAPTFDLLGRQLQSQQGKGIIIRNGKKYVK